MMSTSSIPTPNPSATTWAKVVSWPLAVRVAAGKYCDFAGGLDADARALKQASARTQCADHGRGRNAAGLDIGRKANADMAAVPSGARLCLLCAQFVVADGREGFFERGPIVAAVVLQGYLGLIALLLDAVKGRDEVLAPQLGWIAARLQGGLLNRTLEDVRGLGAAGAAQSVNWRGVGEDAGDIDVDRRSRVQPLQKRAVEIRRYARRKSR